MSNEVSVSWDVLAVNSGLLVTFYGSLKNDFAKRINISHDIITLLLPIGVCGGCHITIGSWYPIDASSACL